MSKQNQAVWIGVVLGVLLTLMLPLLAILAALSIWIPWTWAGVGITYFSFLPIAWHAPSLLQWFWLAWTITAFRQLLQPAKIKTS